MTIELAEKNVEVEEEIVIEEEEVKDEPAPAEVKKDKPTETLEAKKARLERQLKQTLKQMGVTTEKEVRSEVRSDSNDYGEKAFLIANGIKGSDEISLAKKLAKETGRPLDALLESTYFQTELKDFREKKASADATPTGNKRSSNSSVDTVEYWIAKGELPPASEVKLRQDVVNARMNKESSKGVFYNS